MMMRDCSSPSIDLTLDPKGQITGAIRDVPLPATAAGLPGSAHTFDAASQVSGFTYDGLGRLTDDGAHGFSWDLASRLSSVTNGSNTVSFTYDALGNRISRTEGGVTRDYVVNYALGLASISVVGEGGADLRYYIHTPGGSLLYSIEASDNSRRFYHYDEMGNTLFLTDSGGTVIASYAYSPYGVLLGSTGGVENSYRWQGRLGIMQEGDSGLYYIRARYYDSASGRFISRDPVRAIGPKRINPYQYALANPLRFVDVTGRDPFSLDKFRREQEEARRKDEEIRRKVVEFRRKRDSGERISSDERDHLEDELLLPQSTLIQKAFGSVAGIFPGGPKKPTSPPLVVHFSRRSGKPLSVSAPMSLSMPSVRSCMTQARLGVGLLLESRPESRS